MDRSTTLSTDERYSDFSQSVICMKRPFSTRTQKSCFCVSWSAPIVTGGRMPFSQPLRLSSPAINPSPVRFRPGAPCPLREEHGREVSGQRIPVGLVLAEVFLHLVTIESHAGQV